MGHTWNSTILVDVASGSYTPIIDIDRRLGMEAGATVNAQISCDSPWDIDDDPSDDTNSAIAVLAEEVFYSSSDVIWTISVTFVIVTVAWLGGIIGTRGQKNISRKTIEKKIETPIPSHNVDDEDDISLEELNEMLDDMPEIIDEVVSIPEPELSPPIIDDASASGRLGALRKEMASDDDKSPDENKDDFDSRMDRFFSDR